MALALDGSAHASATAASVAPVLTTANANDIIIVIATVNINPVSSITGAGLTFSFIATAGTGAGDIEIWSAVASSALTSEAITVNHTAGFITVDVFGISGADTSTIFDANASTPATASTGLLSISTDTADTFIIGGYRFGGGVNTPTEGAGFTKISGADFQLTEFKIVSSTQSNLSITIGTGNGNQNGGVGEAVIISIAAGRIMSSLVGSGGLASKGGIAGIGGGLAG